MGDHDIFFKQTFSIKEHAVDYLRHVLPSGINSRLDYSSIALENTSYVDDELSEHFSDMVYSCLYRNSESDAESGIKIAVLFEHKSAPDKNLPYQLNKYMVKIWDLNQKQEEAFVPVVPVVLYHGKKTWKPGRLSSCFKGISAELTAFIPDFDFIFVSLADYEDDEIRNETFTLASLKMSLLILKNIFFAEKLEKELGGFFEIGRFYFQNENGLQFLESILNYIYRVTEIKTISVVEAITPVTEKGGTIAMTTAEKLRQEGLQQGLQQGLQEGLQEGLHKGLQEGSSKVLFSVIQNMKKNGVAEENIAKMLNLDVSIVRKIFNNEEFKIPSNFIYPQDEQ